ncbi:hypothetical protein RM545_14685 [Zunongwangia sp. F260]|uniref:Uncharacterized protein n=1 Tax=Autumnicola lenta TaxID=3075593 RepID=A0ABU3CNK4_9FLAO|nr:hypothetical protein [Zunongwangia sp. F260]MDT0647942.1 hypothetical protein [Zunongwangia sp. F260]
MKSYFKLLLIFFFFSPFYLITAQISQPEKQYLMLYDNVIGLENTSLYNGVEYVEEYRTINREHQFFPSRDFVEGNLQYDDEIFYDVFLKFDVYNNRLIAALKSGNKETVLQLISEKVDWFQVYEKIFINVGSYENISGFLELLAGSNTSGIYKQYVLDPIEMRDKQFVYYEFKPRDSRYYLLKDNQYFLVDSSKDFINVFPNEKERIRKFYKSNKNLLKASRDQFMKKLYIELNGILMAKNNKI